MLCISAAYAVVRCLSVTFVNCVKTSNHILKHFSPSGSQITLGFEYRTLWLYSDGNAHPNGDVECRGYERSSPAVAEKPRDASWLSVVSFNSTIRRAQSSVIRYFRFAFTAAYKYILFFSLRRGCPCWL